MQQKLLSVAQYATEEMPNKFKEIYRDVLLDKDEFANWRLFLWVADAGSFSLVADHLKIDRSTVLRRIRNLEKRLNVKLFSIQSRSVSLTPHGHYYANAIRDLVDKYDQIFQRRNFSQSELSANLVVEAPHFLIENGLLTLCAAFHKRHPKVTFEVRKSNTFGPIFEPPFGTDLSFRLDNSSSDVSRHGSYFVSELSCGIYSTSSFLNRLSNPIQRPCELIGFPLISFGMQSQHSSVGLFYRDGRHENLQIEPFLRVNHASYSNLGELLQNAVLINGVNQVLEKKSKRQNLIRILPDIDTGRFSVFADLIKDIPKGPAAEEFLQFVIREKPF